MSAGEHWETLGLQHDQALGAQYDEQERLESLCSGFEHSPASCPAGEYCTWQAHFHPGGAVCEDCCPHEIVDQGLCCDCDTLLGGTQ